MLAPKGVDHAHPEQAVHPIDFILGIPGCFVVIGLVVFQVDGAVGHIQVPAEDQRFLPLQVAKMLMCL